MFLKKKYPKNLNPLKISCNYSKIGTGGLYHTAVIHPKDINRMANSVDSDQEQANLGLLCLPRYLDYHGSHDNMALAHIITIVHSPRFVMYSTDLEVLQYSSKIAFID